MFRWREMRDSITTGTLPAAEPRVDPTPDLRILAWSTGVEMVAHAAAAAAEVEVVQTVAKGLEGLGFSQEPKWWRRWHWRWRGWRP